MDWAIPEMVAKNPSRIANSQRNIVVNLYQDFLASTHSNFFRRQTTGGLIHWLNHSWGTLLPNQENNKEAEGVYLFDVCGLN